MDEARAERTPSGFAEVRHDLAVSLRALASTLANPNLRRALTGLTAFSICEWGGYIALIVFAYDQGGTRMIGVISLIQLLPAAVIAPLGSALGDRFRRERVLLLAESAMALTSALAAAAALAGAPPVLVYAAGCSVGYVLTLVRPTHGALLPWIARNPTELTSAYTAGGLIESSCVLLGPAIVTATFAAATALDVSGPGLAYAVLALLLTVGSIAIGGIRVERGPEASQGGDGRQANVTTELAAGFRYVWSDRRPRLLVALMGLGAFVLGFIDALIVVIAFQLLDGGQTEVGLLNSALGVGGIVGAMIALVAGSRERLFPAFRAGILTYGSSLVVTAGLPGAAPALLVATGAGGTLGDVSGRTMLQRLIPDEKLTRSFGVLESAYMLSEGIGAFVGASLAVAAGPRWTLLVAGSILPTVGFAVRRRLRSVDVGARVPADDLALLRRTSIFEPLPPPALERVARNCVPLDVPAGTVVIREGDVGDRFYVIAAGDLVVTTGAREVDRHGPGGYVGEIALLHDVPRTATVSATTDARLLSLERDEFLRAVTGHAPAREAADAVAAERIRRLRASGPG
jgi:MFS family permease